MTTQQKGKKNRKHNRNRVRSHSMQRYNAELRAQRNSARRIKKAEKRAALCATARATYPDRKDISRAIRQLRRAA